MKLNKASTTSHILATCPQIKCTKLAIDNIIFPKWSDLGLVGMMFRQCVASKEQPIGNIYNEAVYQTVMRVLGGKVLMTGRPDCYCWTIEKVNGSKNISLIGVNSAEGLITLSEILPTIHDQKEKTMFADMFANLKKDLLLIHTPAEERMCIEVTEELYAHGLTHCVDEWMETDEKGEAEATQLYIGDYLIATKNGVYRVGHDEFDVTYAI